MGRSYKQGLPEACMNDDTYLGQQCESQWDVGRGMWDWLFGLPHHVSIRRVDASLSFQLM